ncbi:hypothetical protein [Candidatus Mycolicibacterium alkanivorans]|uniref:Secreted protein n=1 Tax=Candidatus Mycolicibacterium alkanivorans TaxID=2954114 RepID=A0ABS9YZP8_9MYCO|nr:hypothetical protein [Candidatus Mycolicibacterium alkanivorans]MCI4676709.1 hypothetical protein [Candidatus Mycolicibacterium alkanivorans]
MRANIMSAWLCAADAAAVEVWADDGAADDVASFEAELLHAPMAATAVSAASPVTTVFVIFTTHAFRRCYMGLPSRLPAAGRALLVVL